MESGHDPSTDVKHNNVMGLTDDYEIYLSKVKNFSGVLIIEIFGSQNRTRSYKLHCDVAAIDIKN